MENQFPPQRHHRKVCSEKLFRAPWGRIPDGRGLGVGAATSPPRIKHEKTPRSGGVFSLRSRFELTERQIHSSANNRLAKVRLLPNGQLR